MQAADSAIQVYHHHLEALSVILVLFELFAMAQQELSVYIRLVLTVAAETVSGQEKHNHVIF